jgi:ABC-2 type transport system ATP-binding protein
LTKLHHNRTLKSMSTIDLPAIQIKNLTKLYNATHGVRDISLEVKQGEIFGFLGPNGAGKSTTINTILDILRPDNGTITILGTDHRKVAVTHKHIGYLATDMAIDLSLTGKQYLSFVASQHDAIKPETMNQLVTRLEADISVKIKHLSRGNRQKIGLIAALMHSPDVLILDEPTSGLDPLVQAEFYTILREHQQAGKTTFMSSHVLSEVQTICNRVGFIRGGKLVQVSGLEELLAQASRRITVKFNSEEPLQLIKKLPGAHNFMHNDGLAHFTYDGDLNQLIALLSKHTVQHIEISEANLEELFMTYYQKEERDA